MADRFEVRAVDAFLVVAEEPVTSAVDIVGQRDDEPHAVPGADVKEARAGWRQWQRGESAETSEVSLSDVMPSMRSMLFGRLRGLDRSAGKKRSDGAP